MPSLNSAVEFAAGERLQALGFGEDRLARDRRVRTLVIGDLQRIGGLHRIAVGVCDRDDPARHRAGRILDRDGLDEARDLLGRAVVDRRHLRAIAHRRRDDPAVDHPRQERVDAVFRRAVDLERNVELRQILSDQRVLVGGLQRDRLHLVGGVCFCESRVDLARFDDVAVADRLAALVVDHLRIDRDAIDRSGAEHRGARVDQRQAARGARAAHRVEVHHRAPAAAGDDGAEYGIRIFGIVADEVDAHMAPGGAEFLGDELGHRAGDVLAHVGLADIDGDDPVRPDAVPEPRIIGIGGGGGRRARQCAEAADETGCAGADEKRAARKIERARDVLMLGHAFLPAPCASFDARKSVAARSMALTMRG
jgi:hypothetical protein